MRTGTSNDMANIVQPVVAGNQCAKRLKAYVPLLQVGILQGNIRGVADQQVKTLSVQPGKPVADDKTYLLQPAVLRVQPRQLYSFADAINPCNLPLRALAGQRQGDSTA